MASLQQALPLPAFKLSATLQAVAACRAGEGLGLAAAMGFSNVLESLTVNQYFYMLFRIQLHLKVGITGSPPPSSLNLKCLCTWVLQTSGSLGSCAVNFLSWKLHLKALTPASQGCSPACCYDSLLGALL